MFGLPFPQEVVGFSVHLLVVDECLQLEKLRAVTV